MIQSLLTRDLPREMGVNPSEISLDLHTESTPFALSDAKACRRCHMVPDRADREACNEETLLISVEGKEVTVIALEEYLNQFDHSSKPVSKRCDYLLLDNIYDHTKIAFCDLTCSKEKWVYQNHGSHPEGKLALARSQMTSSLEYLLHQPLLAHFITTFVQKVCIFGWRDYSVPAQPVNAEPGKITKNLLAFMTTPSNMAQRLTATETVMSHHFIFEKVKYPNQYVW